MEAPPNTSSDSSSNRRRILFVDDDQDFLQMVERLIPLWSNDGWDVLTAPRARAAMTILRERPVNLLVIDVCMPEMDGLQFLSMAHREYPDVQKIMLTGFATEACRSACLSNGAELFLEKPKTTEGMESIFGTINELIRVRGEPGESLLMQAAHIHENAQAPNDRWTASSDQSAELPPATNTSIPRLNGDAKVEEFLICSPGGDVLHAWQCQETDFRINFLEFLLQKARLLQNGLQLGEFDRVEFNGSGERLLAQVGEDRRVMIRTSSAGGASFTQSKTRMPGGPPSASRKNQAQQWFERRLQLPGLLAAGLQFGDRSGLNRSLSPNFGAGGLETLRRCTSETFQVLNLQRFKGNRARWCYGEVVIECAQWNDATCLALVLSRQTLDLDPGPVSRLIAEFLHEGETAA